MRTHLTPRQRDRIRRLLEAELRAACRSAIDRGAGPADVGDLLAARRRVLADLAGDPGDDDDPGSLREG
jgi:hypothetical protein